MANRHSCISFDSYIKPQPIGILSNLQGQLYIFWFLHQTTTPLTNTFVPFCCISFDSYIKPQLNITDDALVSGCISFDSYIKPQPSEIKEHTSLRCISFDSYIKPQRTRQGHKTGYSCISFDSYIKPQLLQLQGVSLLSCISFDSYIKPQLCCFFVFCLLVVYLLIPTSNHNRSKPKSEIKKLYIFWFLHQTTTFLVIMKCLAGCISFDSYIKPQPNRLRRRSSNGCISFDSYIKPQHYRVPFVAIPVVYLLIPTSNHNL